MSDPNGFSAGPRLGASSHTPPKRNNAPKAPKPPRKKFRVGRTVAGFFVGGIYRLVFFGIIGLIVLGGAGFVVFSSGLPSVTSLETYKPPLESRVYASNFQLVSELATERRIYVPYNQIPSVIGQAFISAEDRLFWVHPGINPAAMIRAALTDVTMLGSGRRPIGASTITEQVVKNMLLDNRITFGRKIKEAILALRVEQVMTKQQILTLYLNEIYLGNNSYGIAAAAETYFDKPLSQLTIAEAASLASLPKAPTSYDPFLHPQAALDRRNFVIQRMLADGVISAADAKTALAEPLLPHAGGTPLTVAHAGYFADAVKNVLVQHFGADQVSQGGLIVNTSLDPQLQDAAENALQDGLERYDHAYSSWHGLVTHIDDADIATTWRADLAKQKTPAGMRDNWRLGIVISTTGGEAHIGYVDNSDADASARTGTLAPSGMSWIHKPVADILHPGDIVMISESSAPKHTANALNLEQVPNVQAALISLDPRTGRVVAMVGGWSHDVSPFNRAIQAQRQPGSSVKPIVYLTAMEQGIEPDATVLDGPFVVQMPDGTVYRPGNFEDSFEGPVPIYHALEQSLNLATLHIARQVGLPNIAKNFQAFGIVNTMPPYYPSAIGAIDTTLWKMVGAYASLDEYGRQVTPTLIDSVTDPDGKVLFQADGQNCTDCAAGDPSKPPQLAQAGAQIADPASTFQMITMMKGVVLRGTGNLAIAGIPQPVAGKTGTTNNFNDAWFIGFTPGIVTGCWIGFDKPQNLGNNQTGGNVCGPIWNEYMKTALKGQPNVDFPVPDGVTLQQTSFNGQNVTEAYKTGQSPGAQAQSSDSLLAGQGGLAPQSASSTGGPGAPAPAGGGNIDKSLGGLY